MPGRAARTDTWSKLLWVHVMVLPAGLAAAMATGGLAAPAALLAQDTPQPGLATPDLAGAYLAARQATFSRDFAAAADRSVCSNVKGPSPMHTATT